MTGHPREMRDDSPVSGPQSQDEGGVISGIWPLSARGNWLKIAAEFGQWVSAKRADGEVLLIRRPNKAHRFESC
ncbi:hypothetical protein TA5114_02677 [Cognatishimia activa]|uniref:Uncharacterized protein n=2 Tax=Cognatishimia activa TaxID=1715691 RepID=A0A0P1ITC8_9RHOB|nr:hypothetical protein TA5114_02677 [Cognatishimia activa]